MKNILTVLAIFAIIVPNSGFSLDLNTQIKGFIALDLLDYKKQSDRPSNSLETGIGVLSIKTKTTYDKANAVIKLDLDSRHLENTYNLFEEAYVSFKFNPLWQIKSGKGLVPFHQKHYGVIQPIYVDGGSVLGTQHAWRDIDRRVLTSLKIGNSKMPFTNHITVFGSSERINFNSDDKPVVENFKLVASSSRTYDFKDQIGIANKLEINLLAPLNLSVGTVYSQNKAHPKASYAFNATSRYRGAKTELWTELVYGKTSTHEFAPYSTKDKRETLWQFGVEYAALENTALLSNLEAALVKDQQYDSSVNQANNYKVEVGVKYQMDTKTEVTLGSLVETQSLTSVVSTKKTSKQRNVFEHGLKLSIWF